MIQFIKTLISISVDKYVMWDPIVYRPSVQLLRVCLRIGCVGCEYLGCEYWGCQYCQGYGRHIFERSNLRWSWERYISVFQKDLHVSNKKLVVERKYKIANSVSSSSPCFSDHRSAVF